MRKDIIITGATGFVGKRFIKNISKYYDKNRILCLVRNIETKFEKDGLEVIKRLKIDYIKVDLSDKRTLKNLPKNPKIVFHLAANTETLEKDHSVNDIGTRNLFETLKIKKSCHFLHASTVTFLATRPDCSYPINEDSPAFPTNEYSRTKLAAQEYLIKKSKKVGFRLSVLNLNTIYGSGVRENSLFDAINKMVQNKNILSRINWPGITSIIHVDDVAKAFLELSVTKSQRNTKIERFLVYTENITLKELYKLCFKHHKLKYLEIALPTMFWKICSKFRVFIPVFEKVLPQSVYNWIWRAGLIVDDAAYCESDRLYKKIKNWNPKLLVNNLNSVFPRMPN